MSSILTNGAALAALQNLSATQAALSATQKQVASGLRVATASDSAAYWSIATTLKSDTGALSAVSDALNLGASVLGVAAAAVTSAITLMNRMKADLVTAQQPGTSAAQVQTDITAQQRSLVAVLGSASFNGVNLLDGSSGTAASFVASFMRSASGATSLGTATLSTTGGITVNGNSYTLNGTQLVGPGGLLSTGYLAIPALNVGSAAYGQAGTGPGAGTYQAASFLSFDISSASLGDIQSLERAVDLLEPGLVAAADRIATVQSTVMNQQTYVSALSDALTSGTGALVDADMNVASTRLQALQTQQQLGVQALSIANGDSGLILKLFGR
ncbi:flagellin [Lichenibacterium dinghuense]|uniref:flagellin N-terminal helical domain-containing protein n=1 Tax=Lichenibacterium dinghuense TaxID=2895977 RepID=UPI001F3EB600|nr:flagellin [Lichenibacterium sp. 6Y81]